MNDYVKIIKYSMTAVITLPFWVLTLYMGWITLNGILNRNLPTHKYKELGLGYISLTVFTAFNVFAILWSK